VAWAAALERRELWKKVTPTLTKRMMTEILRIRTLEDKDKK
jgi:hypothetical protein